jgi:hypothetical protein
MAVPPMLQAVIDFVRKGYPQGVPQQDYIPLLALLRRRLTDEEIAHIAQDLSLGGADSDAPEDAVKQAIWNATHEPPSVADIQRVSDRLREAGWDLTSGSSS